MKELKINPRFDEVCRNLTKDEYNELEGSILACGGITNPILTWQGYIVDGHNRYSICKKHDIEYTTQDICIEFGDKFQNEDDVLCHIVDIQVGRRNLCDLDKQKLLAKKEAVERARAKERMDMCRKKGNSPAKEKLPERENVGQVRDRMASEIGISGKKYGHLSTINEKGNESLKEAYREKKLGADKLAKIAKLPPEEQDIELEKEIEQKKISYKNRPQNKKEAYVAPDEVQEENVGGFQMLKEAKVSDDGKVSIPTNARSYMVMAQTQLERIHRSDPEAKTVLLEMVEWINEFINNLNFTGV